MLKILQQIIHEVTTESNFDEALNSLVTRVKNAIHADAVSVFLIDKEKNDFLLVATDGLNQDATFKARIPLDKGILGLVANREELIHLCNAQEHEAFYQVDLLKEEPYQGYLGIPIIQHRLLYGVIVAQQYPAQFFADQFEAFLITLAAQIGGRIAYTEQSQSLQGLGASPGIGIGVGLAIYPLANIDVVPILHTENPTEEVAAFLSALDKVRDEIIRLHQRMKILVTEEEHALFDVYTKILDRDNLGIEVTNSILDNKLTAESALVEVIKEHMANFYAIDNDYLKQRASDLRDLGQRVLAELQRQQRSEINYPKKVILVGHNVHAANLAEVPEGQLAGIISQEGGMHSHVAILARAMGVPMVVGALGFDLDRLNECFVIIDGNEGQIYVDPNQKTLAEFKKIIHQHKELDQFLISMRGLEAITQDQHKIKLQVNIGIISDTSTALSVGAEGVGLYRSEMNFLVRESFPAEDEQMILYRQVLKAFSPNTVTIRTLDIGGDKSLPYFPIDETNPYLGWRGIRLTLDHPELFLIQIRALLRASENFNNLQILLPMVTWVSEILETKDLILQAYHELREEKCNIQMPKIGVMIETPALAFQVANLKNHVDFISVGSNDLTQYWLAVDRNNPNVARMYQYLHPSMLSILNSIASQARQNKLAISICGEMASDPYAAVLLIAMGYEALSLNPLNLPRIKAIIRETNFQKLQILLDQVLSLPHHEVVKQTVQQYFEDNNLQYLLK